MQSHQKIFSLISLLILSGCYLQRDVNMATPWKWESPSEMEDSLYTILYKPGRVTLSRADQIAMKEIYHRFIKPQEVNVQIAINNASHLENSTQTIQRVKGIRSFLKRQGISKSRISIVEKDKLSHDYGEHQQNAIIVLFETYNVLNPKCPGWNQVMDGHVPPEGEENFGCSNHSNLVNMVADKRRLREGEKRGGSDGTRSALAVHQYRIDKIKKLPVEKLDAAKTD